MRTYKEHYQKCRDNYPSRCSIYDLTYKLNDVVFDQKNFNIMTEKIKNRINHRLGCVEEQWSIHLNDVKDIKELNLFLHETIPQIERKTSGCFLKAEHIHIYENKKQVSEESSWAWHYDDCPAEFIKFAVYLNNTTEHNGAMQVIPEIIESYRTSPSSVKGRPPPVFPKSRIPKEYIANKNCETITGSAGTNFIFTPNIIHRGTIPNDEVTNRIALFVFLRPSLKKIDNYLEAASCYLPKVNVKKYELD